MAAMMPYIFSQFLDDNGDPLDTGTLTFYATGTTDPLDTYSDATGETANQNPLQLDSAGRSGPIFMGEFAYDIVLKDSLGNTVDTYEAVSATGSGGSGLSGLYVVGSVDAMRALTPGVTPYLLLSYYTTVGDGISFFYYWDAASVAADDDLLVIAPDTGSGAGRWLLQPFDTAEAGSFTITMTGCTATITGTAYWSRRGSLVTLLIPFLTGTSNTTACTLTGLPARTQPTGRIVVSLPTIRTSDGYLPGLALLTSGSGTISLMTKATYIADFSLTAFPNSGVKQLGTDGTAAAWTVISYLIQGLV